MVFPLRHSANKINGRREEKSLFEQNLIENLHLRAFLISDGRKSSRQ